MQILISPAKKMRMDPETMAWRELPLLLPRTEQVLAAPRRLRYQEARQLWACSDAIAEPHYAALAHMDLRRNLTPALLAYQGIQYQYLAPQVLEAGAWAYLQEHLWILSGFYGLLRPLDGVVPYRLEMQAPLAVGEARDLYQFWGSSLAGIVTAEDPEVLNLASREYARSVEPWLGPSCREVTCVFGELRDGRVIQKATQAKMARGEMVRFLAERQAASMEEAKGFNRLDYCFCEELSTENQWIFLKKCGKK